MSHPENSRQPKGAAMPARTVSLSSRIALPRQFDAESGSQTTEYALIMVVAATIASLALAWARNGAIADLLDGVLDQVRSLFGVG
jgi:hypothetical protein